MTQAVIVLWMSLRGPRRHGLQVVLSWFSGAQSRPLVVHWSPGGLLMKVLFFQKDHLIIQLPFTNITVILSFYDIIGADLVPRSFVRATLGAATFSGRCSFKPVFRVLEYVYVKNNYVSEYIRSICKVNILW